MLDYFSINLYINGMMLVYRLSILNMMILTYMFIILETSLECIIIYDKYKKSIKFDISFLVD